MSSARIENYIADEEYQGERIDIFLSERTALSRNQIQKLCDNAQVHFEGRPVKKNYRLEVGDTISVSFFNKAPFRIIPEEIPLSILYEDDDVLVVDKPQGLVVYPGKENEQGTLANALLFRYPDSLPTLGGEERPGIVHRLDKDTSGVLLVAKTELAYRELSKQIKAYAVTRQYQGIVYGEIQPPEDTISLAIMRDPVHRTRMITTETSTGSARNAKTYYSVIKYYHNYTHLLLELHTGRTHQLRVHLAAIGYPIVGDPVYGNRPPVAGFAGQCLHACRIAFDHPVTGKRIEVTSPLPDYFQAFLEKIR